MSSQGLVRSWTYLALSNIASAGKALVILPVLVLFYGLADYGLYTLFTITLFFLGPLSTLCLDFSLVRFLPERKEPEESSAILSTALVVTFLWAALISLVFFVAGAAVNTGGQAFSTDLLYLVAISAPLSVPYSVSLGYFRGMQRHGAYSTCVLIQVSLEFSFVFLFSINGFSMFFVVLSIPFSKLITFLIAAVLIFRRETIVRPSKSIAVSLARFSFPLIPSNLFSWTVNSADRYIINYVLGPVYVATYSAISVLSKTIQFVSVPFDLLLTPRLCEYQSNGNLIKIQTLLGKCLKYFLISSIPILAILIIGWNLIPVKGLPSISSGSTSLIFLLVGLGSLLQGAFSMLVQPRILAKDTKTIFKVWGFASAISLAIDIILIPIIGILGAGVGFLISSFMMCLAVAWPDRDILAPIFGQRLKLPGIAISSTVSIMLLFLSVGNHVSALLSAMYFSVSYVTLILLTRTLSIGELKEILGNRRKIKT